MFGGEQHDSRFVDPGAVDPVNGFSGVRFYPWRRRRNSIPGQPVDVRRIVERNENPLRPVLKIPAALGVVFVIAADEISDYRIGNALTLDQPGAAAVQAEPAIDGRHVRPFGHCLFNDVIHVSMAALSIRR